MNTKDIERIIALVENTDIAEIEYQTKDDKIKIKRSIPESISTNPNVILPSPHVTHQQLYQHPILPQKAPTQAIEEPASKAIELNYAKITSPFVGTFYRAPAPDAEPFIKEGDRVKKGDSLCIVEAMKLMNEIESDCDGIVKEILIKNAQPVEYNEVLFYIEKN